MYSIYMRDSNLKRLGEIADYNKLDLIPRFNAVGSFLLDLPTDSLATKELIKNRAGIIVKKDNQTIFSGTVTRINRKWDADNDTMTFAGKCDNAYLNIRLAYPEINGNFSLQDYDVRTGKVETIMRQFVDYNAGPNALPERRILSLAPDTGLGSIVTGRGRFHTLIELLQTLAGGLGFRVVQVGNELQFQVYQPSDKTRSAFFSPLLGNLSSFEYSQVAPEANYTIVGGGGEGVDRILLQKGDSESITKYGRIESFIDQRNTSDDTELIQSLDEELTNKAEKRSFNFQPIDTPQLAYNKDYGLGDKVSIVLTQPNEVIDQETLYYFISAYQTVPVTTERVRKIQEKLDVIQDVVREVKISITPDGDSVQPVVGTEDSTSSGILGIFDKMRKLSKRVSNLERR